MTFLNPLVLLGLAAAAIPILVHLFNFRRPRRVDFSSLAFVRALEKQAMRRLRVRQWLLLALRTAALVFLVLAFARPTYTSAWGAAFADAEAASRAVVLDNSLSMTLRDADGALFDQARRLAAAALEAGGPGDERLVLPTAPPPGYRPLLHATPGPALDVLETISPAAGAQALATAAARAAAALEAGTFVRRDVVLVSDLQASTFADSGRVPLPPDVQLTLVPVGRRPQSNTAVTDVRIESRLIEPGRPVLLAATVERYGAAAGSVAVRAVVNGQTAAETAADVAPGRPATVRFQITPPARGWVAGEVRLEPDAAPWDDVRYFALRVPPAPRVLVVRGDGQRADRVTLALSLAAETGAMAVSEVPEAALGTADLGALDAVLLVGPRTISAGAAAALGAFVARGGGVVLFPHEAPDGDGYARLFGAVGGGRLAGTVGQRDGPVVSGLAEADLEHPLFAGLFDPAETRPRLENVDVRFAHRYAPGGGDESTLIRMQAGAPFLHEVRRGPGRLLWVAVAPDERWSDLPTRGLFVPLLYRAVGYLAAGTGGPAEPPLTVRRAATIRVEGVEAGVPVRLVAPGGESFAPAQRVVEGGVILELDDAVAAPGIYRVVQGERTLRLVAFNEHARESDPAALSPAEAARRLEALTGRPVRVVADAPEGAAGETASRRWPLWSVFLLLALACLVAETLVAMRWRPEVPAPGAAASGAAAASVRQAGFA
ncbi:MAG: BatA domain-containing protein [Rubricoccaceae bacterium]